MLNYKEVLQLMIIAMFGSTQVHALDGEVSLDVRGVYLNYGYDNYWSDTYAFATSAKLGYKKNINENLEVAMVYGTIEDFGINSKKNVAMSYMFNRQKNGFSILHQAYLKYKFDNHFVQVGRFEFSSPLINSDDYFLLSNSFEGITSEINYNDININVGHISRMSGAWDAGYDGGSFESMSRSPWMHKADKGVNYWPNSHTDFGVDDSGISYVGLKYIYKGFKLQLWDYYAHELMNSIYMQVNKKYKSFDFGFQYNLFSEVGQTKKSSNVNAKIGYSVWGATVATKISTDVNDIGVSLAYMGVSDDESSHLFGSWGGYPYFASGMMVTYFETSLRGANIFSSNATVTLIDDLSTTLHVGYYGLEKEYTKNTTLGVSDGEDFMYTYGISNSYRVRDNLSFVFKVAGRKLESGNESRLIRSILKYNY